MSTVTARHDADERPAPRPRAGWREIYLREDWWAIWLGLAIVFAAWLFFVNGSSIKWIAVSPKKWHTFAQLGVDFREHAVQYLAQFLLWLAVFGASLRAMGHRIGEFVPAFVFVYAL
jgi:hypothetical protein